jgi:hypothetical protein
MRPWKRNRTAESNARLDTQMLESRASFIEHYNATFDFEAGLDEVYARAGLARANSSRLPRRRPWPLRGARSLAVVDPGPASDTRWP